MAIKPTKREDPSYFLHKVGSQLLAGVAQAASIAFRATGQYQSYYSRYHLNESDPLFDNPLTPIYQRGNPVSTLLSPLLPVEIRRNLNPTEEQLQSLSRQNANEMFKLEAELGKVGKAIEFGVNLASLYLCLTSDKKVEPQHVVTYAARALSSGIYFLAIHNQGMGAKLAQQNDLSLFQPAIERFIMARRLFLFMNVMQATSGITKIAIEVENAIDPSKKANVSAAVDGGLQTGLGLSWLSINSYLLKESSKFAAAGRTEEAADVLRVQARLLPKNILWATRISGLIGSAISAVMSGKDIYSGTFDDTLSDEEKEHRLISGSIGMASSAAFAGFAYFINPATLPVGAVCFTSGLILLGAQTIYDEWGNGIGYIYAEMVNEMMGVYEGIEEFVYIPARDLALDAADAVVAIHGQMVEKMAWRLATIF